MNPSDDKKDLDSGSPFESSIPMDTLSHSATVSKKVVLEHEHQPSSPVAVHSFANYRDSHQEAHDIHFNAHESLAFEDPDGPSVRQHYSRQTKATRVTQELISYFFTGWLVLTIVYLYVLLIWSTEKLSEKRIHGFSERVKEGHHVQAVAFAVGTSLVAALIPALVILLWAPSVIGSGMVQLIGFLNGANAITKSNITNLVARYFGILGISVAGLYSGIDGPFAMIGASSAVRMVTKVRTLPFFRRYFYGEFQIKHEKDIATSVGRNALFTFLELRAMRLYVTLGAAVGIAAIFRSPLGGVMFTLEETTSFFEAKLLIHTLFSCVIAVLLVSAQLESIFHTTGSRSMSAIGGDRTTLFPTNDVQCHRRRDMTTREGATLLFLFITFGVVIAVFGMFWNRMLSKVQAWRQLYSVRQLPHVPQAPVMPKTRPTRAFSAFLPNFMRGNPAANPPINPASTTARNTAANAGRPPPLARSSSLQALKTQHKWFTLIRLVEVAVVCIITSFVVVLVPTIPGADPCLPLERTTEHAGSATPSECTPVPRNGTTPDLEAFDACLEGLGAACLPEDLKLEYTANIIHSFFKNTSTPAPAPALALNGAPIETNTNTNAHPGSEVPSEAPISNGSSSVREEPAAPAPDLASAPAPQPPLPAFDFTRFGVDAATTSRLVARLQRRQHGEGAPPADGGGAAPAEGGVAPAEGRSEKLLPVPDLHHQHVVVDEVNECYYPLQSLLYSFPERQLKLLLTRGLYDLLDIRSLSIFLFIYISLSLFTYYIALPTDLVIPNLIVGAILGRTMGLGWNLVKSGLPMDPGFFAMIGMAGMWSATSRLTLTVIVVTLELTGDMDSVPALIIVCFTASWVSSFLGESLYHREMHQNKTPYLPSDPSHSMRTITVRKIMSSRNLVVITTHPRLSACLSALQSGFIGFPVCEKLAVEDSTGQTLIKYRPVGFVYRDLLAETLKRLVDDQGFDPDQTRIDMTPLSNVSPVVVREDSTASKVFGMVRQLGLRHVMVVNHDGFLVGILTRKDLLRGMHYYDHIHHKKGHGKKKKHQQQHHAHARGTLKRDKMTMKIWAERPKSEKEREGTASSLVIPATDVPGTPRHTHFGSTGGLVVPPLPVPARGDTVLDLDTLYHQHLQQHGSEDSAGDLTASTANLLNQPGEHHTHSPPASPKLGTTPTPVRRAHFQDTAAPPTIATAFPFPETSIPIGPRTPTAPHSTSTPASPSVTPGRAAWNRTRLRLRANAGFTLKKLHDDSGDDVAHSSSSSSASSSSSSDSSSSDSSESESEGRGVRVRFGERARQTRRERRERRGKNRAMMIRRRTGL